MGGNILNHPDIEQIMHILKNEPYIVSYYMHYKDILIKKKEIIDMQNSILSKNNIIKVIVEPNILDSEVKELFEILNSETTEFDFIVENKQNIQKLDNFIEIYKISNFNYYPFYNKSNLEFFEDYLFLDKNYLNDILPSAEELEMREYFNQNMYGKLNILPNLDVYSDLNKKAIGNLEENTMYEIVYNEINQKQDWMLKRDDIYPCNDCCYNKICPPISHYETFIGKYNLCHIKN